jgi:hypothetical protein
LRRKLEKNFEAKEKPRHELMPIFMLEVVEIKGKLIRTMILELEMMNLKGLICVPLILNQGIMKPRFQKFSKLPEAWARIMI